MKRITVGLFILAFVLFAGGRAHAEAKAFDGKIAYVDLAKVFDQYQKTKEYDAVLEKENAAFQDERNKMIEKVRDAQGKLALLKEDEKAKLQADIDKQKADLLEFDRQKRTDLTRKRDEKIREILLEIEKVVSDYAKKEGYTLILNDRVLIYAGPEYNITDPIVKILNDNYPKAGAKK